jgi:hypothetical protein
MFHYFSRVTVTTILVPLMSALLAGNILAVNGSTWLACTLALAGIVVMNLDLSNITSENGISSLSSGDSLILGSALMYTMHVIRLGKWAPLVAPLRLAASKSSVETILSIVLVVTCVTLTTISAYGGIGAMSDNLLLSVLYKSGSEILSFFATVSEKVASGTLSNDSVVKAAGATLWAGWVVTA